MCVFAVSLDSQAEVFLLFSLLAYDQIEPVGSQARIPSAERLDGGPQGRAPNSGIMISRLTGRSSVLSSSLAPREKNMGPSWRAVVTSRRLHLPQVGSRPGRSGGTEVAAVKSRQLRR